MPARLIPWNLIANRKSAHARIHFCVHPFSGSTKTRIRYISVFGFQEITLFQSRRLFNMVSCEKWAPPGGGKVQNHSLFLRNNVWSHTFAVPAEGAFCVNSHYFSGNNVSSCDFSTRPGTLFSHETIWITISNSLFAIPWKVTFHPSRGCDFGWFPGPHNR